jgi:tetratricopeptide (TPR) repeat protein
MRAGVMSLCGVLLLTGLPRAAEPAKEAGAKPPWQRLLQGDEGKKAAKLEQQLIQLQNAGKFEDALHAAEEVLALRTRLQGADHWETVNARTAVTALRQASHAGPEQRAEYAASIVAERQAGTLAVGGRYREARPLFEKVLAVRRKLLGEEHPDTASGYNNLAYILNVQGKYAEAAQTYRKALDIYRKALGEEHPDMALSYHNLCHNLNAQGKYAEAQEGCRKARDICLAVLGEKHPLTAKCCVLFATNLNAQGKYAEAAEASRKALDICLAVFGEENTDTAACHILLAGNLQVQGHYAEAEKGYRKALAIHRKVCGEDHPLTANGYNHVGNNLSAQGKYAEATEFYNKALDIDRKVFGEEHPDTAQSYNNVAANLHLQARYTEAAEGYRKALDIARKVVGEEHPLTASCYNNLATNLKAQGRYEEAAEGYRKALSIRRTMLGEEHPETALSYHDLAHNLQVQGKYAEAEEGCRKALDICRKALGEEHPDTATSYNYLALNLQAQGKYAEAAEGFSKALDGFHKAFGEAHPDTGTAYNNVALNLNLQGKYAEADHGYRKALAIRRNLLGEFHPGTAQSYNNLALNLKAQGKYAEAAEDFRKALDIRRKLLGEEHPDSTLSYNSMGVNLHAQGQYAAAEEVWLRAARSFAAARLHLARSGLDRATVTSERSPLTHLACVLARNGKPAEAWARYEESLSRGTWDDLSARLRRPPAEQAQQAQLSTRLERLEQLLTRTAALKEETPEQKKAREELLSQHRAAQDELDAFARRLEKTYGPVAGQVFDLRRIQAALPAATALVGWIDFPPAGPKAADPNGEHWAFLLRSTGEPRCLRLPGKGGGAWTEEDTGLPAALLTALTERRPEWQRLAQRLAQQRLGPLGKYLAASDSLPEVKHLIILPTPALAGVPVELLAEGYTVSYAHSGTLFAHLRSLPKVKTEGLFALADPVFASPTASAEKPLPPGGVLLTVVQPGSNAMTSRLRPGDVLLSYNGRPLSSAADLAPLIAAAGDKPVSVTVWREGKTRDGTVGPGKLGVVLASKPAAEAIAEQRRLDHRLSSRGGDSWRELPGSRAEVASLTRLFGDSPSPRVLTDSEASEQKLYELAESGELKKYRYLHLATHGEVDERFPLRSAVILSRDALPDPGKQLLEGKPVFDGSLTAEEVLRQWNLDCDLVTLSACETALGKYERGEGFVGFAQALILCGSRSVCLSLWQVDDAATALLMQRFYANLLGKREGLKAPLGKAAALAEAKRWLRTLPREQALKHAAAVYQGIERGKGRTKPPLLPALPEPVPDAKEDCPYAHPYYWAAFILTGDPD